VAQENIDWQPALRVDFDPMIADTHFYLCSAHVGNDHIRILYWHMASDAVRDDVGAELRKFTAVFGLVAGQAAVGIFGCGAFGGMDVVAEAAGDFRGALVTATAFEESYLIAVDVDLGFGNELLKLEIQGQGLARDERECRGTFFAQAAMTFGTYVDLAVEREYFRIHDFEIFGGRNVGR